MYDINSLFDIFDQYALEWIEYYFKVVDNLHPK